MAPGTLPIGKALRPGAAVALLVGLISCSPGQASQLEDQTRLIQPNLPTAPMAPAPAALPVLTPCAPGWRELPAANLDEGATCDPWPEGGVLSCPADSAHFPGTPGCARIGSACPVGEWADDLPTAGAILYVRAGAGAGGTGSKGAPFGTVKTALLAASPGTIVALGKGTFDEAVRLPEQITLWGACVSQTVIKTSTAGGTPSVAVTGSAAVIRNLSIASARPGIFFASPAAGVELRDLLIWGAVGIGVYADKASRVTGSHLVIRGTRPAAGTNDFGQAIEAIAGAQVDLTWVALESNFNYGAHASGMGTRLTLSDAVVRDTQSELSTGEAGRGLSADGQARLAGQRVILERNRDYGVTADTGAEVFLSDTVVRDTSPSTKDPDSGLGGSIESGGHMDLRRVVVQRNRTFGWVVAGPGSVLDFSDLVIEDTLANLVTRDRGIGMLATQEGRVKGARLVLARSWDAGLSAEFAKTLVELEDVTAIWTEGQKRDGFGGNGLIVQGGARLSVTRALVGQSRCTGILAQNDGTLLTLVDVTVRGGRGCLSDATQGYGLGVGRGATGIVSRILLEQNRAAAIFIASAGAALSDVLARDTFGEQVVGGAGGQFGNGLLAATNARVELSRARFERSREFGLIASGARISGSDVVVRETLVSDCPPARCPVQGGLGALSSDDGSLVLTRFSLTHNAQLGLELSNGGTADVQAGEISDNPIGVNVQTKDFDLARIQRDVVFRGNGQAVNSDVLPVPDFRQIFH